MQKFIFRSALLRTANMSRALVRSLCNSKFHVQIVGTDGEQVQVPVYSNSTADKVKKRALRELLENDKEENEMEDLEFDEYSLVIVKRDAMGVVKSKNALNPGFLMKDLAPYFLKVDDASDLGKEQVTLFVAQSELVITVFFNVYCRMVTGCPHTSLDFYYGPDATVADINGAICNNIGIKEGDKKFSLFGCFPDGVKILRDDEMIADLKDTWGSNSRTFFQYQILVRFTLILE